MQSRITTEPMSIRKPAQVFPPGDFIREELEERGWTQIDLAKIMDRPVSALNAIIAGKKSITPETALELSGAFGTSPEFWLNLENAYKLSKVEVSEDSIRARARLFEIAPIKEMERRSWIKPTKAAAELEQELRGFFRTESLDGIKSERVAARVTAQDGTELTSEQRAWCVQALRLAERVPAAEFVPVSIDAGISKLRELAAFPEEVRKVPRLLSEFGIRFVVVEHLPKTKIDGAALWLGDGWDKPVIALSARYDRIDGFWHTLCHELSHIKHKDSYVVDIDIVGEKSISEPALSEMEIRANREAAEMLIPAERLRSFISRVRPYYTKERIIQFANLMRIHPGIVAGQLQHLNEINWTANREMLVKVRHILTASAMTDGWGSITKNPEAQK
jgi:HTH-type transcriptional regulator / antitoxin HigA